MAPHSENSLAPFDRFQRDYRRPREGRTLIAGSRVYPGREDRRALFAQAEGWDMLAGDGVDRVVDIESDPLSDREQFNHIECISVLEHSRRPWRFAAALENLLAPSGTLFLSVPFIWGVHAYPDDYWRFTISGVRELFPSIVWTALLYGHRELNDKQKVPAIVENEHRFLARTEVYGFGIKQ